MGAAHGRGTLHETVELAGLPVARVRKAELLDHVFQALAAGRGGWIVTANVDFLLRADTDAALRDLYRQADWIVADGMPLLWAARLRGRPFPERIAGADLVLALAWRAALEGRSLHLVGGQGDAAARAAERLRAEAPGLRISGLASPWLSSPPGAAELAALRAELETARPDLLYVALGSPKQEQLIRALRPALPGCWMLGCGISLSFLAGDLQRAPGWVQRTGLEWLHRLGQEPGRLGRRYLVHDLPFALRLLWRSARR